VDWQLLLVALALASALSYLGRRALRTWSGRGSACAGCKCDTSKPAASRPSADASFIPSEQLGLRRRA
jgi:hypothetical protein